MKRSDILSSRSDEDKLFTAVVLERDSRVTVLVKADGGRARCHLRNTGRLKGLIYPGAKVLCESKEGGKTDARLLGSVQGQDYVLLDTYLQEKGLYRCLVDEKFSWVPPVTGVKEQATYGDRRFDFKLLGDREEAYLEVKSAVTCEDGWASYPDAPSERGLEHVRELTRMAGGGLSAFIVFVVTHPGCGRFRPNRDVHPATGDALETAADMGVDIRAVKMVLRDNGSINLRDDDLPVYL